MYIIGIFKYKFIEGEGCYISSKKGTCLMTKYVSNINV